MKYKIGLFLFLIILFRGPIFRLCFQYQPLQIVPIHSINDDQLKQQISTAVLSSPDKDIKEWGHFAQKLTAQHLQFSLSANSSLPNEVWRSGKAHCVGYAALMGAILQEIIRQKEELSTCKVEQVRADIYLFGFRLTGPNRPAFFKDHDFIRVTNTPANHQLYFDPSLYDYSWIKRIQ